jgi:putative hemolysin
LRTYLSIGAKICGPPAIDREFGTIDFLTLLDLHTLDAAVKTHFGI